LWNGRHAQTRLAQAPRHGFDIKQVRLAQLVLEGSRRFSPHGGERARKNPVTIITDPLFYLLALPAVVALGLSKGGFAGAGQIATPMLALMMPPLEAAAVLLPIMMAQDAAALWVYRKDWNGRILATTLPGALLGVGAAWVLAAHISDAAVRALIGVTTICFVLYHWIGPRIAREVGEPAVVGGVLAGAMSGFTSTLCQAGGPPFQMYTLAQNLAKMKFVGTTAFFFATVNALKVVPYFALGQFSTKGLGTSLVLLPLAMATNILGFWVVRVTPQELFYKITIVLMFVISIELVRSGMTDILRG
jgi:uncharacterized protein